LSYRTLARLSQHKSGFEFFYVFILPYNLHTPFAGPENLGLLALSSLTFLWQVRTSLRLCLPKVSIGLCFLFCFPHSQGKAIFVIINMLWPNKRLRQQTWPELCTHRFGDLRFEIGIERIKTTDTSFCTR